MHKLILTFKDELFSLIKKFFSRCTLCVWWKISNWKIKLLFYNFFLI